jgi:hypothetical protein
MFCPGSGSATLTGTGTVYFRSKTDEGGSLTCHDEELLLLKATSQATVLCMESALAMLQVSKVMVTATGR